MFWFEFDINKNVSMKLNYEFLSVRYISILTSNIVFIFQPFAIVTWGCRLTMERLTDDAINDAVTFIKVI